MFALIKNLLFGSANSTDPFDMEHRTKALLAQTQRNRMAGRQVQQRAHRPTAPAMQKPVQRPQSQAPQRANPNTRKAALTNLKSDLF